MAKFCTKCGASCDDSTAFCTSCGAKFDSAAQPQAAATAGTEDKSILDKFKENANVDTLKGLQKNPNFNKIVGIAAVGVLALIILIILISTLGAGYKKPIGNFLKAIEEKDPKAYVKTIPDFEYDYYKKKLKDSDKYDKPEDLFEEQLEKSLEELEDDYGKKIKLSYKVVDKEKLDDDDLKDIKKIFKENYDEKSVDVSKGYEVDVEVKVKGKDDKDEEDVTFTVVKVNGDWVIYEVDGDI